MSTSMEHLISIIVPVYNVEKYLKRCVDSLLKQSYTTIEIILVDDGSTDNSKKLCDDYLSKDKRIRVIHKTNGGLSSARNAGMKIAQGEYIGFIDSDDWVDSRMFEVLITNMLKYNADVSDIESKTVSEEKPISHDKERIVVKRDRDILVDYFLSDRYSCCRKLYKKNIVEGIEFPVGKINEDIATNFLFLQRAKCLVKSSLIMYYYFKNTESITGSVFRQRDFDLIEACENLVNYAFYDEQLRKLAQIKLGTSYYSLLGRYVSYPNEGIENLDKKVNGLRKKLKQSYSKLLFSHIKFKKKILISLMVIINPKVLKYLYEKLAN